MFEIKLIKGMIYKLNDSNKKIEISFYHDISRKKFQE